MKCGESITCPMHQGQHQSLPSLFQLRLPDCFLTLAEARNQVPPALFKIRKTRRLLALEAGKKWLWTSYQEFAIIPKQPLMWIIPYSSNHDASHSILSSINKSGFLGRMKDRLCLKKNGENFLLRKWKWYLRHWSTSLKAVLPLPLSDAYWATCSSKQKLTEPVKVLFSS